MSTSMLDEVKCPICIDTLKKPIRILACGHNLCQRCLVDLCQDLRQRKCPTCRKVILLTENGVEGLPRNHVVENIIDRLAVTADTENTNPTGSRTPTAPLPLSDEEIIHYKVLADTFIVDGKFQDASVILHYLTNELEGISKLQPIIKWGKCLFELGNNNEAKRVCLEIFSIIDLNVYAEISSNEIFDGCDEEIKDVVGRFIEISECDVANQMIHFLYVIIKCSYDGEIKLMKLRNLGELIEQAAVKMKGNYKYKTNSFKPVAVLRGATFNKSRKNQFLNHLQLLENICNEMKDVNVANIKKKCLSVARILMNIEYCTHNVYFFSNFQKSIEIDKQAITLIETVLGATSGEHKFLALLYKDLGWALKCSGRNDESKKALMKAIQLHNTARDWDNEDEKTESLFTVINYLKEVDKKYVYSNSDMMERS